VLPACGACVIARILTTIAALVLAEVCRGAQRPVCMGWLGRGHEALCCAAMDCYAAYGLHSLKWQQRAIAGVDLSTGIDDVS